MFITVYKENKRQLAYSVSSVEECDSKTLKRWRDNCDNEVDPLECPFDLYLQDLLMQFEPAICVTVNRGWGYIHGFIWFDWGCLSVHDNGDAHIYIDESVHNVSANIC